MGIFGRIRESLSRTKEQIIGRFDDVVRRADAPDRRSRAIDVETIDALEEVLVSADLGMAASSRIIAAITTRARGGESLRDLVKQEIRTVFAGVAGGPGGPGGHRPAMASAAPSVTL